MKALGETIIIRPVYSETKSNGTIIIPDIKSRRKYVGNFYGIVIAVGKHSRWKNDLKKGDRVAFVRHEGIKFEVDRVEYLKLKDKWVLCKIEEV